MPDAKTGILKEYTNTHHTVALRGDRPRFPLDGVVYFTPEDAREYLKSGAWIDSTLGEELRAAAREQPAGTYIIADDAVYTFGELDAATESAAAALVRLGVGPGDRALFQAGSVAELVIALFACFKVGVVPVCALPQHREIEIGQLAQATEPSVYFAQADYSGSDALLTFAREMASMHGVPHLVVLHGEAGPGEHSLREMASRVDPARAAEETLPFSPSPADVAVLQLSGGSTGAPKIIPRMHGDYLGAGRQWNARQGLTENDRSLWALPLIHNAGMIMMLYPSLIARRPLVIQARFDIQTLLQAIQDHGVTYTGSIGPIAPKMIEYPDIGTFDLSRLRTMFTLSRAAALEAHTGVVSQLTYGITEGLLLANSTDGEEAARHITMGWPVGVGDDIKILQPETDMRVPKGAIGELCFRGPHSLRGYYNAAEFNGDSFTSDGFFRTGDLIRECRINGRAHYVFEGRLRDNINRGGEKYGAEQVEALIADHPAVGDARVVAMPDLHLGERGCAYLILRPGHDAPSVGLLGEFLLGKGLAKYKLPERIEIVSEFPLTRVGKVDKAALRAHVRGLLETGKSTKV